jgi:hypothetical protein
MLPKHAGQTGAKNINHDASVQTGRGISLTNGNTLEGEFEMTTKAKLLSIAAALAMFTPVAAALLFQAARIVA